MKSDFLLRISINNSFTFFLRFKRFNTQNMFTCRLSLLLRFYIHPNHHLDLRFHPLLMYFTWLCAKRVKWIPCGQMNIMFECGFVDSKAIKLRRTIATCWAPISQRTFHVIRTVCCFFSFIRNRFEYTMLRVVVEHEYQAKTSKQSTGGFVSLRFVYFENCRILIELNINWAWRSLENGLFVMTAFAFAFKGFQQQQTEN